MKCYDECDKDERCAAITLRPRQMSASSESCWLYEWNSIVNTIDDKNFISYFKRPYNSEVRSKDRNTWHYKSFKDVKSATHCYKLCLEDSDCYVSTLESGVTCYLFKYDRLGTSNIDSDQYISIYKSLAGSIIKYGARNFDHFKNMHTNSAMGCYRQCINEIKCSRVTFDGGNNCYLYSWYNTRSEDLSDFSYVSVYRPYTEIRKGIRLYGHYHEIQANNNADCYDRCAKDTECIAITYPLIYNGEKFSCYLYKSNYGNGFDSGWSSQFKTPLNANIRLGFRISNSATKVQDYFSAQSCFNACSTDINCKAISFKNTIEDSKINCYFYNYVSMETADSDGWITYLKK